ncbi:WD40-repeat-containing domain protein [Paraphysoderma sedebokerense]|nr:WD40-repeat-containing domain protein [Paraphysoderma sedebokerense]
MEPPKKPPTGSLPTTGSESYLRDQVDKLFKESKSLKQKVDILEKENMALKKSVYELSARYAMVAHSHKIKPFTIDIDDGGMLVSRNAGLPPGLESAAANVAEQHLFENLGGSSSREKSKDGRIFTPKTDLKGHTGAVYAIQFSPCGKFLASGSFDKTVRIWDMATSPKELNALKRHTLNVSDLCWSNDSSEILSGGYDQTCKTWDVESGKMTGSFESEGFVQCVMYNPQDNNIFFNGTSRKVLGLVDRRKPDYAMIIRNDAMVNSLYVYRDGTYVVSGDSLGYIKTWDIRTGKCSDSLLNEPTKKPISHIAMCRGAQDEDDEPRFMAVNSYDNVIRVYDRGFSPPKTSARLLHALKGYKNKNWPIKSAAYQGKDFTLSNFRRPASHDDGYRSTDVSADMSDSSYDKDNKQYMENGMLFATGSADPFAYVYAIGETDGVSELLQRLEGHSDRVYAVSFHPTDLILATCSADFTIKLWAGSGKGKKTVKV